jgi:hypothetical protein
VEFQKQWAEKGLFHQQVMSGCFANNVLVLDIDIILYRNIYLDKLQKIILYSGYVLIIFSGMTISVVSRKFDSDNMGFVEIGR